MKKSTIQKVSLFSATVACCVAFSVVVNHFSSRIENASSYAEAYNAVGSALVVPFCIITLLLVFAVVFIVDKFVSDDKNGEA